MKKVTLLVLAVGLFAGAAVEQAQAQGKRMGLSLNLGVQTNIETGWEGTTSFDKVMFIVDARAGVSLGKSFEISPEVMAVFNAPFYFFENHGWLLYPGVLVNYRAGGFFAGAGVVKPLAFSAGEAETGNFAPKINIGYRSGKFQVTVYFIAWTEEWHKFLDVNWAGIMLGFRF
jgi:hypothetical protein